MGCIPFGEMLSMAFGKQDGKAKKKKKRGKKSRKRRTGGDPEKTVRMPTSVTYETACPIVVTAPESAHAPGTLPDAENTVTPSTHASATVQEAEETRHVRFAVPEAQEEYGGASAKRSVQYNQPRSPAAFRYVASPLPVTWEQRREYFGGDYCHYYPTPIRENIYHLATDANRLTTIFSDENPNACSIM